jgi:hypothetical protein
MQFLFRARVLASACVATAAALAVIPSAAQATTNCGHLTVRGASGPIHTEIDVLKGRVACARARAVTAYAWSPRHRSRQGNKFLGDPPGWTCVVARATNPAVAGTCVRRSDGAVVRAFDLDYGE